MEQSNGVDALQTEERLREEDGNGVIAAPQALVRQSKSTVFFSKLLFKSRNRHSQKISTLDKEDIHKTIGK
jgi:hypothetical protein